MSIKSVFYNNLMAGSKGLSPTHDQAHVGLNLLTLVSYILLRKEIYT